MSAGRIFGNDVVIASFARAAESVGPKAFEITRRYGVLAQTKVRANMSGRSGEIYTGEGDEAGPAGEIGPRAITGDLRRSVTVVNEVDTTGVRSTAGSNEPQALRLELGFVGVDSLGRHYDQPPYPAWRPAHDELEPGYRREIEAIAVIT